MLAIHPWMLVAAGTASGILTHWSSGGALALIVVGLVPVLWSTWAVHQRLLWTVAVSLGWWAAVQEVEPHHAPSLGTAERAGARVSSISIRGSRAQVFVETLGPQSAGIVVHLDRPLRGLSPGSTVVVEGPFRPLKRAANPGGFDAALWGQRRRVHWEAHGEVQLIRPAGLFTSWTFAVRRHVRGLLERTDPVFGASVLQGILLGDRGAVPESARRAFERTGTAHLLAVSGLHVAGVAGIVFFMIMACLLTLGVRTAHRIAALAALGPTFAYVLLADAPLSAQRAGLMVAMFMLGVSFGRRPRGLDCLGFAATALLVSSPLDLFSPGFQFSFGSVFALLYWSGQETGPRQWLWTSALASLSSTPVQAWHFGSIVPCAMVSNMLVTPLASALVIPFGLLCLLIGLVWSGSLTVAAHLAELLVAFTESVAALIGGEWIVGRWAASLCLLPFGVALLHRRPLMAIVTSVALTVLAAGLYPPSGTVDFLSVGQGDAILIRSGRRVVLIDAGPSTQARRLRQHLRIQGVSNIDEVIITHHHPDHYRGLSGLLGAVPIGRIVHSGRPSDDSEWNTILERYGAAGIPIEVAKGGDRPVGQLNLRIFPPLMTPWVSENDGSLAMRLDGQVHALLLTGDLESLGEAHLLAQRPGKVDVLKLGHHGSRTSTGQSLLDVIQPRIAVVSLGLDNRYGFPHEVVESRLGERRIPLLRTDIHGLVRVHLDHSRPITLPSSP